MCLIQHASQRFIRVFDETIRGSYATTPTRRHIEKAGTCEPKLVINHRLDRLFDAAQRSERASVFFLKFQRDESGRIIGPEIADSTGCTAKRRTRRMSLVWKRLGAWATT
jgi:hypothetical protein